MDIDLWKAGLRTGFLPLSFKCFPALISGGRGLLLGLGMEGSTMILLGLFRLFC